MIRYSELISKDFLAPDKCNKLVALGIDMSDATYSIWKSDGTYYITEQEAFKGILSEEGFEFVCKTYTVSDMVRKLSIYQIKLNATEDPIEKLYLKLLEIYKNEK